VCAETVCWKPAYDPNSGWWQQNLRLWRMKQW